MAKYSREELERNAETQEDLKVGAIATGLAALLGAGIASGIRNKNNKKREEINQQIQEINQQIAGYKSKFFGSTMYADEISALERKRKQLKQELEKL